MIGQERLRNPRLGQARTLQEFVQVIDPIDLPDPRRGNYWPVGKESLFRIDRPGSGRRRRRRKIA